MGEAPFRQEEEHTQRACGRKESWVSDGQEGSLGDWNVMSEGKRRLEMLTGTSAGRARQSMSVVDFLLLAIGSPEMFDTGMT